MVMLALAFLMCAIPLVLGYRLMAGEVNVRALNGALLLALGVGMLLWMLSNMTFDAGY